MWNAVTGQAEAHGVRVSTKAGEQFATTLQRLQQVQSGKRAPGAMSLSGVVARNDQCRAAIALHDSRGGDPNDAAMPAVAGDHQRPASLHSNVRFRELLLDRCKNA